MQAALLPNKSAQLLSLKAAMERYGTRLQDIGATQGKQS
jgi:hypothetical protein